MRILGVIPARFASTRFPGKPLADIAGKSMIQRVYEQCLKSSALTRLVVATDDDKIAGHVGEFGEFVMTASSHPSGTDRCREAMLLSGESFDYVINIQGDEPFINPSQIDLLAGLLNGQTELATLSKKIEDERQINDPNVVKVVKDMNGVALYFSRHAIPYHRGSADKPDVGLLPYFKHIGIYAYRSDVLERITQLPVSQLERAESLEQLRWLENGFRIKVAVTELETQGIDTPEDLERVLQTLNK